MLMQLGYAPRMPISDLRVATRIGPSPGESWGRTLGKVPV